MEEKKISETESLEIISQMISRTKDRYIGNGNVLLLWGYLTVLVTVVIWALLAMTHNEMWNCLWYIIPVVGGIATFVMKRKNQGRKGVKNYSDKISSKIWTAVEYSCIVSMLFCCGFELINKDCWDMMFAFALIIVPFAEVVQGVVVREKSLTLGGVFGLHVGVFAMCCMIGGIKLDANWFLPLFVLAFICMMILPGHVLNLKSKRQ